jgi:protein-S-isoprenylcysteine O-methyltransferase Ste14
MAAVISQAARLTRGFVERGGWWVLVQFPALVLAILLPTWTSSLQFRSVYALDVIGALLTAMGLGLFVLSAINLGRSLTPFPRPTRYTQLRQQGLYAWMRHPLYTGVLLASTGWAIWWRSWPGLCLGVLLALFFDRKASREERWLRERFPEYGAYSARVRKFIPGIY